MVRTPPEASRVVQAFLPTEGVLSVVRMPRVSPVAGARPPMLGVAQVDGAVLPVLAPFGEPRPTSALPGMRESHARVLVVCLHAGERVGVAGIEVVSVGHFDGDVGSVRFDGDTVPDLDLPGLVSELHARPWAGRVRA
ncbi:MAG: chemotaxis protein CheW [Myxococcales bacterium]|nr:chemotaxis protein CheW [Myxococcales bacterium]